MADDAATQKTEGVHILGGPDGSVYMISDRNLAQHRVSKELVPGLLKAFAPRPPAPGQAQPESGAFKILAKGQIPIRAGSGPLPPIDTWVDTM
jgi:hypothetical protein